jgi:hypothetical protein
MYGFGPEDNRPGLTVAAMSLPSGRVVHVLKVLVISTSVTLPAG